MHPWDRREGESTPAYEAFCAYRDAGRERTLLGAYRERKPDAKQLCGQWSDWSRDWDWLERARSYDAHLDSIRREVRERRLRELEERRADFEIAIQAANEQWVTDLDGEIRAAISEGYLEIEEDLEKVGDDLTVVKRTTHKKYPALSAVARLLKERHESLRVAVEGPRLKDKPSTAADPAATDSKGGAAFVWVKPKSDDPEEPSE